MGLNQMISFCSGYLEIIARGSQLEKFINLTTGSGLLLWDVKRLGADVLQARMRAHGFGRIRGIARRSGCTVKIVHKHGWPFIARKMARRKLFFVGAALFCCGLVYISSLVLFIKLEGVSAGQKVKLLQVLHQAGLREGEARSRMLEKKGLIEREALLRAPAAVWLGITIKGVVAEVKVVPRKVAPAAGGPSDIVAASDGLVTKVMVVRGVPLVKEGDTVVQGQLLISGTQWYNDLQSGETYKEDVPASGVVEAKVWNDFEIIEPKQVYKAIQQQNQFVQYRLRWKRRDWQLAAFGKRPGADYFWQRRYKQIYRGRNPFEIVELIKDTWQEVRWRKVRRSMAEIRRTALTELNRQRALLDCPDFDLRAARWTDEGTFLKLQMTLEDIRDIAKVVARVKK